MKKAKGVKGGKPRRTVVATAAQILAAIVDHPTASGSSIAARLGISRQRVSQVRVRHLGAGRAGARRLLAEPLVHIQAWVPGHEVERARQRAEPVSARVRRALQMLAASEDRGRRLRDVLEGRVK